MIWVKSMGNLWEINGKCGGYDMKQGKIYGKNWEIDGENLWESICGSMWIYNSGK